MQSWSCPGATAAPADPVGAIRVATAKPTTMKIRTQADYRAEYAPARRARATRALLARILPRPPSPHLMERKVGAPGMEQCACGEAIDEGRLDEARPDALIIGDRGRQVRVRLNRTTT